MASPVMADAEAVGRSSLYQSDDLPCLGMSIAISFLELARSRFSVAAFGNKV